MVDECLMAKMFLFVIYYYIDNLFLFFFKVSRHGISCGFITGGLYCC